jgi:hypothetical protein
MSKCFQDSVSAHATLTQHELLEELSGRFAQEKYKLLVCFLSFSPFVLSNDSELRPPQIVDSIMALFRTDFSGRGELSERQQKAGQLILPFDLGLTFPLTVAGSSTSVSFHPINPAAEYLISSIFKSSRGSRKSTM